MKSLLSTGTKTHFGDTQTITVPGHIAEWKASESTRHLAANVQLNNREAFLDAFAAGKSVLGFDRDADGSGHFRLGQWDEEFSYAGK